jgi:hypothetical protein
MSRRSALQVMTLLSKGVRVPDEDIASGIAPATLDQNRTAAPPGQC